VPVRNPALGNLRYLSFVPFATNLAWRSQARRPSVRYFAAAIDAFFCACQAFLYRHVLRGRRPAELAVFLVGTQALPGYALKHGMIVAPTVGGRRGAPSERAARALGAVRMITKDIVEDIENSP